MGKTIKLREFPREHKVKLFRVVVSENRTDWVVTNDLSQSSTAGTQKVCAILVWIRLTELARKSMTTIYQIKQGLLGEYLKKELRSPNTRFSNLQAQRKYSARCEISRGFCVSPINADWGNPVDQ